MSMLFKVDGPALALIQDKNKKNRSHFESKGLLDFYLCNMKKKIILSLLKGLSLLPFPVLYAISDFLYFIVGPVLKYRKKVIMGNLTNSFPGKSQKEIKAIARGYYHFLCDVIVETVKTLTISPEHLKRRFVVENPEIINASTEADRSAVLFLGHFGNWEWVQEIGRYFLEKAYRGSIYHPLKSKTWDEIMLVLRSRWKMHLLPMSKTVRTLLDKENQPWIIGFIADQRAGFVSDRNWLWFLNQDTTFITGPEDIGRKVGADYFYCDIKRLRRGYYTLRFVPLEPDPDAEFYPYTHSFYRLFERSILAQPEMWMWSHKRWKHTKHK